MTKKIVEKGKEFDFYIEVENQDSFTRDTIREDKFCNIIMELEHAEGLKFDLWQSPLKYIKELTKRGRYNKSLKFKTYSFNKKTMELCEFKLNPKGPIPTDL